MKDESGTDPQQDKKYFFNREYVAPARFLSYYEQLELLNSLEVESILEIGVGAGVFLFLADRLGKQVRTMDHNPELEPDFTASITEPLPLEDGQFDMVAAFQVLEHLPLSYMSSILREFARISRKYVLISVPDRNWYLRIMFDSNYFKIHKLLSIKRLAKVGKPVEKLNPEKDMHYWHIGDRGVTQNTIRSTCTDVGLKVIRSFRSKHNPNHHFFLLDCSSIHQG